MYVKIECVEATEISVYCTLLAFTVILHCGKIKHLDLEPLVSPFCYRLLAQLRDMEMAFDDFFDKHHLKLQQYLQLLRYEHSFQEVCWFSEYKSNVNRPQKHWTSCILDLYCLSQMESSLEKLSAQERKLIVTGETLTQTEQIIKELDILEKRAQVAYLHF